MQDVPHSSNPMLFLNWEAILCILQWQSLARVFYSRYKQHNLVYPPSSRQHYFNLKVCHPRCVRSIIQAVVCIYLYIHTVMNTTILQLVAIYNIQLHVSALCPGHHQVVHRTYSICNLLYFCTNHEFGN